MKYYIQRFIVTILYNLGLGVLFILNLFKRKK